jgi:hypothetical protein
MKPMAGTTLPEIQKLFETSELPELGPGPRPGVFKESELETKLDTLFDRGEIAAAKQPLVRALVFLWHDQLESAHVISQSIHDADGAFVHGIVHRREPDYGNAKYWFYQVGQHGSFPELVRRVQSLFADKSYTKLASELVKQGRWDPFAFVDACELAAREKNGNQRILREMQAIESRVLLDWFTEGRS